MEREDVAQLRQRPLECSSDSTPAVVGPSPAGVCAEGAQCERTGFSAPCELQGMAGPGTFATGTTLPPSAVGTGATGQRKVDAHAEIRDCCAAGIACQVVVLVLGICSVISNFWLNFDRADQCPALAGSAAAKAQNVGLWEVCFKQPLVVAQCLPDAIRRGLPLAPGATVVGDPSFSRTWESFYGNSSIRLCTLNVLPTFYADMFGKDKRRFVLACRAFSVLTIFFSFLTALSLAASASQTVEEALALHWLHHLIWVFPAAASVCAFTTLGVFTGMVARTDHESPFPAWAKASLWYDYAYFVWLALCVIAAIAIIPSLFVTARLLRPKRHPGAVVPGTVAPGTLDCPA